MTSRVENLRRLGWWVAFAGIALFVAVRMGMFALESKVVTPAGVMAVPNTFASVDHPFHVARADLLWRSLGAGQVLRWISQHQGGYPVEFYPLGEAWLEVAIRALSLGRLTAQGAHTPAVVAIFLLPAAAFAMLAREDGWSPAAALLALALHVSLPGSWYDGGYTELVQWGLVTNVSGATAAFLAFPLVIRCLRAPRPWIAAAAAALSAFAVYSNPRSLVGLAALAVGALLAAILSMDGLSLTAAIQRLGVIAGCAALLAAPELLSLVRFGHLYAFVQYSGYATPLAFAATSVSAVGLPVIGLAAAGIVFAGLARGRLATRAAALALVIYVVLTLLVAFVPAVSRLAAQLEPTRLMPLQRLLTIYLAASVIQAVLARLAGHLAGPQRSASTAALVVIALATIALQTRPVDGAAPDPASQAVPAVSLYPVAMSGVAQQADLETAVQIADRASVPGTALLILGSALSWHQQLWAPIWTDRLLYYDNWLWYWQPFHAGTPGYRFESGHHYPDAERTLERKYLVEHGIGAVLVTGSTKAAAAASPLLQRLEEGLYDVYLVQEPTTVATVGGRNAVHEAMENQRVSAVAAVPGEPVVARFNWYPRWAASSFGSGLVVARREDGYIEARAAQPIDQIELRYQVEPIDWLGRILAGLGVVWCSALLAIGARSPNGRSGPWYARLRGR